MGHEFNILLGFDTPTYEHGLHEVLTKRKKLEKGSFFLTAEI
jgi:hypothetical protein